MAAPLGADVVLDARLRERAAGDWEGKTRPEIDEGWPGYLESGRRPPGYEADVEVLAACSRRSTRSRGTTTATCWS